MSKIDARIGSLFTVALLTAMGLAVSPAHAEEDPGLESAAAILAVAPSGEEASAEEYAADKAAAEDPDEAHIKAFLKDQYPAATACGDCHPRHYRQWSVSQHAYAQMSPVFNAMHGKILKLTNGTNGDFCIRCHTPVGMNLEEPEFMSNIDRHPTSREGVTCIVCHRLNQSYGKLSGRLAIVKGDLTQPIIGPKGDGTELGKAVAEAGLVTDKDKAGRQVHGEVDKLFQLNTSGFCGACHDVTLVNGFRLEEAFSEYKTSPAAKKGVSCQDCHMGKEPGAVLADKSDPDFIKKNYDFGPAAVVGSFETEPRKLTNHMFVGPDYSVLHPALFPMNIDAIKEESQKGDPKARGMATIREWIQFDWKAGWGTDDWEDELWDSGEEYDFPERWESVDDRYDARALIQDNLLLLKEMQEQRLKLLRNGYKLGDIVTKSSSDKGLEFAIQVKNGTDGHNVPTGFDAERLVWLHVRVFDADGKEIVYEHEVDGERLIFPVSGGLDPNGDVLDLHSLYVHNHQLPQDKFLFSLQSKFVTRNLRGGEREQVLAVNYSPNPLPFVRPEPRSTILQGRPSGARKHKQGIEPNGHRWATYKVPGSMLTGKGPYKVSVQLKAAMVPVNLLNEIKDVGFDYDMSARDVADALVHGHVTREANGEYKRVIWREDSDDPNDNQVVGHQVVWEKEAVLE